MTPEATQDTTRWGDYTPGPWKELGTRTNSATWRYPDMHSVVRVGGATGREQDSEGSTVVESIALVCGDANHRLISKAHLIPRLEAALDACVEYLLLQGTDRAAIALTMGLTSVLAELRAP